MAWTDETLPDATLGGFMNPDRAEHHRPVNAEMRVTEVTIVPEEDDEVSAIG